LREPYTIEKICDDKVELRFRVQRAPEKFSALRRLIWSMGGVLRTKGHTYSTLTLSRDYIETPLKTKIERSRVDRVWSGYPDTYFEYASKIEYWRRKAESKCVKSSQNYVGVTCGQIKHALTSYELSKADAQTLAKVIRRWVEDPDFLLEDQNKRA
jgi:hypothetical protein